MADQEAPQAREEKQDLTAHPALAEDEETKASEVTSVHKEIPVARELGDHLDPEDDL